LQEYLRDMRIRKLGDIICILKHAKVVLEQWKKENSFKEASNVKKEKKIPVLVSEREAPPPQEGRYKGRDRSVYKVR
jgi:hypothetical protein